MIYPVAEKFVSINGEGKRAGELAVFIRFRECNLCCSYCDTRWANSPDSPAEMTTLEDLVGFVSDSGVKNVTLTGGEPLLQKEIYPLIEALMKNGCRVEIETNGSVSIEKLSQTEFRPEFTLDYKLPSSGMESRMLTDNYKYLDKNDTVKFVSGSTEDLDRACRIIEEFSLTERCHVFISPVFGCIDPADIVEYMKDHRLNDVRLQLQMHKFIWSPDKKGV